MESTHPSPSRLPEKVVSLPAARLVTMSVVVGAIAGLALWGVAKLVRPDASMGVAAGVGAGVIGTIVGALVIQPWVGRPLSRWPALLLAAQGIGFFGTLFVSALLYSTTRPDPVGLAAGSVVSFVGAVIGHARVFGSCARSVGRAAAAPGA